MTAAAGSQKTASAGARVAGGRAVRPGVSPLCWFALAVLLQSCSPSPEESRPVGEDSSDRPLTVYAVNYPLAWFAERIGGAAVDVHFPVPADVDPATWSPDAEAISAYQSADLILLNGAGYAAWVSRATLPSSRLVDTSAEFADRYLAIDNAVTHTHGPEGEHDHGNVAFTTWLDPELARLQAGAVRDALIRLRPERDAEFLAGYESLAADLNATDDGLRAVIAMLGGQPVLFSHPVYQYLARRYGLNARSLHWEPDQAVTDADLVDLEDLLRTHPARILIWEAEPTPATRARLDALGISSVVFEPCANRPTDGDYMDCMRNSLASMESLL